MQLGSSSQSGRNRGATAEADANGEQQLKRTQSGSSTAALHRELSGAGLLTWKNEGEVAEQVKRAKLLVRILLSLLFGHGIAVSNPLVFQEAQHA